MTAIILCAFIWYVIGVASHIYWWTAEFDYTPNMIPLSFLSGLLGVLGFLILWGIHGDKRTVIISRRFSQYTQRALKAARERIKADPQSNPPTPNSKTSGF